MRASLRIAFYGLLFAGLSLPACRLAKADDDASILKSLKTVSTVASTVPSNGDVNPYGIVRVERSVGKLEAGHILISNFNNIGNLQGTGTTIVDVSPGGALTVFAQLDPTMLPGSCPGGIGLTTALAVLRSGWVIVGSLPTNAGSLIAGGSGCLIVLDSNGNPVETFYGSLINGPWDMTWLERGDKAMLFVTNVLDGTLAAGGSVVHQGTVVRINLGNSETQMPWIESMTVIGSGFAQRTDPAALVLGATGVALSRNSHDDDRDDWRDRDDDGGTVLYVADTVNSGVRAISNPLFRTNTDRTGKLFASGGALNQPLGLTVASNGNVLTVNGADGFIIEFNAHGNQVAKKLIDNTGGPPPGAGTLFGLIFVPDVGIYFVDDGSNTLNLLH
ncbi:MAG TPA: hypothetical protein VHT28_18045 [Silvibacterium sp.]|jgi:hypothetical protein|nr:hypothetical protein [Silvibacterium sp.]